MASKQDSEGVSSSRLGVGPAAGQVEGAVLSSGMYRPSSSSREVSKLAVGDSYWIRRCPPLSARPAFDSVLGGDRGAETWRDSLDQSAPYAKEL